MTNNDLISRSELLAEIDRERKRHIDSGNYGAEHLMVHSLRRLVEEAPAVDAAPVVHARWIQNKTVPSYHFCSNCKRAHNMPKSCNVYVLLFYCPDCGAKMDKEE